MRRLGLTLAAFAYPIAIASAVDTESLVGYWAGEAAHKEQSWSVGVEIREEAGRLRGYADFADYGVYGTPLPSVRPGEGDSVLIAGMLRDWAVRIEGEVVADVLSGTFRGIDVECPIRLTRSDTPPPAVREIPVKFANGDVSLNGALILPEGDGPFPACVMTHGSGNSGLRSTFYRSRGVLFARHGIAALMYDKRGVGQSEGDWQSTSLSELTNDALAAVAFLKGRSEIDAATIGVSGWSQGGWLAPWAAAQSEDVAFVVAGAVPGITPAAQNNFTLKTTLKRSGIAAEAINEIMRVRELMDTFFASGERPDQIAANEALAKARETYADAEWNENDWLPKPPLFKPLGVGRMYWSEDYLLLDPASYWPRVRVPVLCVWGEEDTLVPASLSRERIGGWLREAGNDDVTLEIFPNAGHGLALLKGETWDWPRMAPGYHALLVSWLSERFR